MKDPILLSVVLFLLLFISSLFITWVVARASLGVTEYLQTTLERYQRRASLIVQVILFSLSVYYIVLMIININQLYVWTAAIFGISMFHCGVYMVTDMQVSRLK